MYQRAFHNLLVLRNTSVRNEPKTPNVCNAAPPELPPPADPEDDAALPISAPSAADPGGDAAPA